MGHRLSIQKENTSAPPSLKRYGSFRNKWFNDKQAEWFWCLIGLLNEQDGRRWSFIHVRLGNLELALLIVRKPSSILSIVHPVKYTLISQISLEFGYIWSLGWSRLDEGNPLFRLFWLRLIIVLCWFEALIIVGRQDVGVKLSFLQVEFALEMSSFAGILFVTNLFGQHHWIHFDPATLLFLIIQLEIWFSPVSIEGLREHLPFLLATFFLDV